MVALTHGLPDYRELWHSTSARTGTRLHWVVTGTQRRALFGGAGSGREVRYSGCSVWNAADGRLVEGWLYPDREAVMAQLTAGGSD
jgi:predicted ester cyclase